MKWAAIEGELDLSGSVVTFKGKPVTFTNEHGQPQIGLDVGLVMSKERFSGGQITAQVEFERIGDRNGCGLVFYYDPTRRWFVSAGLGGPESMYVIRHWDGRWTNHALAGSRSNLEPGQKYQLKVEVKGSRVILSVDDVEVLGAVLPFLLPPSQTGIHFLDDSTSKVSNFRTLGQRGRVFVVMEFSSPFMEIHEEVIKTICNEFELDAYRADETYGPGLIIADVTREISESQFVIAEITPSNPNVYYELGYAHAINKPVILMADKAIVKQLPFDVSGFRTLFYENSIPGKRKFDEALRKNITAILQKDTISG